MLSSRTARAQVGGKVAKAPVMDPVATELMKGGSTKVRSRDLDLPGPNNNP